MGAEVPAAGPYQEFATELRRLRKAAGLTQVQLRERMLEQGDLISQGMVSQYESGETGVGDERTARLETALGCDGELWEARRRDATGGETTSVDSSWFLHESEPVAA